MNTLHACRLSLVGLASLVAASAFAQDSASSYYYGGLSIGQSRATIDEDRITATLLGEGLSTTAMSRDERDTAYRLFGGYQFNRYLGLEAGVFGLGTFGFKSTTVPEGTLTGQIKLQGLSLDLVGTLPLSERWSAIGRIGAQSAHAHDSFRGTGAVSVANANPSKSEINYKVGAGLQYEINPSFFVRGEVERYRINDAVGNRGDIDVVSLSLVFPFGRAPARVPAPVVAAPAYVAPAPEPVVMAPPQPVAVVVPPRHRVSLSADSLFAFDAAEVRPEARADLDTFAKELGGAQFEVITVEGHTDRLGSAAYNQRLSVQRAESVKAYLVTSGGLDATRISAIGKGESTPVTKAEDCKGSLPHARLIACLQADRRVEVEVTGTR
jgi:OOP family OmpA-OmpF porin